MKAINVKIGGQDCCLIYNGAAMFEIEDMLNGANLFESIRKMNRESCEILCKAVTILAEQGELTRRALGYDPEEIVTVEKVSLLASPMDLNLYRRAVMDAVLLGYGREIENEDDVDLGLIELEQKKTRK